MIEVEQLSKTYGATVAVQDVSFRVEPGEILGFLGPNGAGKTTTMRILSGYLPATTGTARVADHEVHTNSMAVRKAIGYLPESPPLYLEMTVEGFLYFVARIKGVVAGDRAKQVESAMKRCNILHKRKVLIRKLSKGFRQRVGIAQAIVHDPPVIILDEPTVGLDPRQIIEVRNLIKSLAGEHTIILSTHILPEVSMTCDRVTIINQGKIVATDTPANLQARLAGQLGYAVEIRGEHQRIQDLLGQVAGVDAIEPLSAEKTAEKLEADHHRFQVMAAAGQDPGSAIATAVVQAGFGLYELARNRVSLEDVFINLTTEETPEDSDIVDPGEDPDAPEDTSPESPMDVDESSQPANGVSPTPSAPESSSAPSASQEDTPDE